ncbi:MAG: hypothetical protein RSB71_02275 [Bacilli bacterium]
MYKLEPDNSISNVVRNVTKNFPGTIRSFGGCAMISGITGALIINVNSSSLAVLENAQRIEDNGGGAIVVSLFLALGLAVNTYIEYRKEKKRWLELTDAIDKQRIREEQEEQEEQEVLKQFTSLDEIRELRFKKELLKDEKVVPIDFFAEKGFQKVLTKENN